LTLTKIIPLNKNGQIVIAGAGPAGLTASIQLSRDRIQHILLEKGEFPKDKICGDALSGKVLDIMKKLDPEIAQRFYSKEQVALGSYGVKFVSPSGTSLDVPFKNDLSTLVHAPGFISKRTHFDQFLFEQLDFNYCDFRPNTSLKSILREDGRLLLKCQQESKEYELACELLIGAEGDRSVVSRQLGNFERDVKHYCAGIRCYYSQVSGMHAKNFIELHFIKDILPGYFWIFPLPGNQANVGIGIRSDVVSKRKINLREKFREIIRAHPSISERFKNAEALEEPKGWGLPLGSKRRQLSGDNYLLTGDAASLIDPFTGEGIGNAMASGLTAARCAKIACEKNRYDGLFLKQYGEEVYRKLGPELNLSHTLQKLSGHAWLFDFVVGKASKNKALQETITSMFDDTDIRSRLKSPLFYFRLMFNRN